MLHPSRSQQRCQCASHRAHLIRSRNVQHHGCLGNAQRRRWRTVKCSQQVFGDGVAKCCVACCCDAKVAGARDGIRGVDALQAARGGRERQHAEAAAAGRGRGGRSLRERRHGSAVTEAKRTGCSGKACTAHSHAARRTFIMGWTLEGGHGSEDWISWRQAGGQRQADRRAGSGVVTTQLSACCWRRHAGAVAVPSVRELLALTQRHVVAAPSKCNRGHRVGCSKQVLPAALACAAESIRHRPC